MSVRMAGGTSEGTRVQSGSLFRTAASVSLISSLCERPLPGQHLVEHTPECPHVAALVRRPPFGLLRAHVGGRAEQYADLRHRRRGDGGRLRHARHSISRRAARAAFASPKSSTFTVPSGFTLMFAGFRSR